MCTLSHMYENFVMHFCMIRMSWVGCTDADADTDADDTDADDADDVDDDADADDNDA